MKLWSTHFSKDTSTSFQYSSSETRREIGSTLYLYPSHKQCFQGAWITLLDHCSYYYFLLLLPSSICLSNLSSDIRSRCLLPMLFDSRVQRCYFQFSSDDFIEDLISSSATPHLSHLWRLDSVQIVLYWYPAFPEICYGGDGHDIYRI